jgi:flagellar L-ring protein precursor FlgH
MKRILALLATVMLCAIAYAVAPMDARADSIFSSDDEKDPYSNGLYAKSSPRLMVGDVVKVRIREKSVADVDMGVNTKDGSKQDVKFNTGGFFKQLLNKATSIFGLGDATYESSTEFKGDGTTDRKVKMDAMVTALVVDRLTSGNLVIEGRKRVKINAEEQTMVVRGVICPRDLDSDYMVDSDLVADAEIEYVGQGELSKKSKPGFLSRVLDAII